MSDTLLLSSGKPSLQGAAKTPLCRILKSCTVLLSKPIAAHSTGMGEHPFFPPDFHPDFPPAAKVISEPSSMEAKKKLYSPKKSFLIADIGKATGLFLPIQH